jgi:hypothetical protein
MFKTNPDVYILANTFRVINKKGKSSSSIFTAAKTKYTFVAIYVKLIANYNIEITFSFKSSNRVKRGNTRPIWEEDLRLAVIGKGCVVVLNVLSKHSYSTDTVIGQCIVELDSLKDVKNLKKKNLRLPVQQATYPIHDSTGALLQLVSCDPQGKVLVLLLLHK